MRPPWHRQWHRGRHGPPPFVRRMGCLFAALIMLAAVGASTLVSLLFRAPRQSMVIAAAAVVVLIAIAAAFTFAIRRVGRVFREQDRLRRQLMADVAHELRTPLAILQGRIEGLADGVYARDDAQIAELLDQTRHLARLVDDLQTVATAEAGALELRKESVDIAELIRDAAGAFDRRIDVDLPDDLPPLQADPVRMREVFLNLLSNAVRHTPAEGSVRIRGRVEGRRFIVRVSDTGAGIPPEELPRIFDRFHKGTGSGGSGLGLAIARDLVNAHRGEIHAESVVGQGTTVTVIVPFA